MSIESTFERVSNHRLGAWVLDDVTPALRRQVEGSGSDDVLHELFGVGKGAAGDLSELERYALGVFRHQTSLDRALKRILHAAEYVRRVDPIEDTDRGVEWIEYNFSVYLVSLASLGDICLLLTNAVMDLGLSPEHCTEGILRRNRHIRGSKVGARLRVLLKDLQRYREERNAVVHRLQRPRLQGVVDPQTYALLGVERMLAGRGVRVFPEEADTGSLLRQEAMKVASSIENDGGRVGGCVSDLLDALAPCYQRRAEVYRQV